MIATNTFGANSLKFNGKDHMPDLKTVVQMAVMCAKTAVNQAGGKQRYVALDIGPTGKLLAPLGDLGFEQAVSIFSETIRIGAESGADLILIETMNDSFETKAAVLAAKETCDLSGVCHQHLRRAGQAHDRSGLRRNGCHAGGA